MAKLCIYCGQPLPKENARFCSDCGQAQLPPARTAAPPSAIKVKLPPLEFSRAEPPPGRAVNSQPNPAPEAARPLPHDPVTRSSPHSPKRPVRLTAQESSARPERSSSADRSPLETSHPEPEDSFSTMVAPGWQEELALLRQEQLAGSPSAFSDEPASPAPQSAPAPTMARRAQSDTLAAREASGTLQQDQDNAASILAQPANRGDQPIHATVDLSRRELRVKVWEQEPTVHLPYIPPDQPVAGPAPAVEQTPFSGISFGPDEEVAQIADFDTVLWPAAVKPVATVLPESSEEQVQLELVEPIFSELAEEIDEVENKKSSGVENQPTTPIIMVQAAKPDSSITIERASTPVPKNWPRTSSVEEKVEDLPTRPLSVPSGGPRTPNPIVEQPSGQIQERPDVSNQYAGGSVTPSRGPNPVWPSGVGGPDAFGQGGPNAPSQPGTTPFGSAANSPQAPGTVFDPAQQRGPALQQGVGFNPSVGPAGPQNPSPFPGSLSSQPGNALLRPEMPGAPQRPTPQGASVAGSSMPRPLTPLPTTPQPEPATVAAALEKPRKHRRFGGVLATALIILLLGGGAIGILLNWSTIKQYFVVSSSVQPYQSYQNNSLGFALNYPQGWQVNADQTHSVVHFADNSQTGQVNLSEIAVNNQTVTQYLGQETNQLGVNAPKTQPVVTFAGASWQEVQGSIVQSGATYSIALYITQHSNRFYTLSFLAPVASYAGMEQNDFSPLRSSFQFL